MNLHVQNRWRELKLGSTHTAGNKHAVMTHIVWSDHEPSITHKYAHTKTHTCAQTLIKLMSPFATYPHWLRKWTLKSK